MPVCYEDPAVGDAFDQGSYSATVAEILDLARRYDPQWFHTDPIGPRGVDVRGSVASGWHTAAVTMRSLVDDFLSDAAALGAKGVDDLGRPRPIFPGDERTAQTSTPEKRSESPERGLPRAKTTTSNGDDRVSR